MSKKELAHVAAGRALGTHRHLASEEYLLWIREKMHEMSALVQRSEFILSSDLNAACSVGTVPSVLDAVNELSAIFSASVQIESDIFRTHGPDEADGLRAVCLGMTNEIIEAFEACVTDLEAAVAKGRSHKEEDGPLLLVVSAKFTFKRGELFTRALTEYKRLMGL